MEKNLDLSLAATGRHGGTLTEHGGAPGLLTALCSPRSDCFSPKYLYFSHKYHFIRRFPSTTYTKYKVPCSTLGCELYSGDSILFTLLFLHSNCYITFLSIATPPPFLPLECRLREGKDSVLFTTVS